MGLLGLFRKPKKVKGSIGYFGLESWWLSEFTDDERRYISEVYRPLGSSGDSLTTGVISSTNQTVVGFLHGLAGWFGKDTDRAIAYKMLKKAEELSQVQGAILDMHFLYGQKLAMYYKDRDKPGFLNKAIEACNQQIQICEKSAKEFRRQYKDSPLPGHKGYKQLAIILEKQGKLDEAVELCRKASNQGWAGDWDKRIERCQKKSAKA